MEEYLALLRENEEKLRIEREKREAEKAVKKAKQQELDAAWQNAIQVLIYGDQIGIVPEALSAFLELAKVLKKHGFDRWLPEMAANFANDLNSHLQDRQGQLFITSLLIAACRPRASITQLAKVYNSYVPDVGRHMWRSSSAHEVREFLADRIVKDTQEQESKRAADAQAKAKARTESLLKAANRRSAFDIQLFAVYWKANKLGEAAIRDKWNESNPKRKVGAGEKGRIYMKSAISRGHEFITKHKTSLEEMVALLKISF